MKHRKNEGEEYIQAIPRLKKWINECNGCHTKGYDPAMPEHIGETEWNLAAYYVKKYFKPQALDENGFCEQCAKHGKRKEKSISMDRTVEERFIRQYIKEDRQERLLFELFSKKNRKKALSRFAHGAELLLKPGYRKCAAIDLSFLKQVKTAYVIPSDCDLDGADAPGETVFSLCQNETSPVIVIGEGFAVVREEVEAGAPAIFLFR